MSEKMIARKLKVVIQPVYSTKPYHIVRCYDTGRLIVFGKKIYKQDLVLRWLLYNQSLIDQGFVKVMKKEKGSTRVVFDEKAERHFKLFIFHIYSVLNIRSSKRADCLAKCWSRLDAISPIIDILWELMKMSDQKRFSSLLRGYCLCR